MALAVSHDVFCKGFGTSAGIVIISHHLDIAFGITIHDIANQDSILELLEYQVQVIIKKKKRVFGSMKWVRYR